MKNIFMVLIFSVAAVVSFQAYSDDHGEAKAEGYEEAYAECKEKVKDATGDEEYLNMLKECLSEKGFEKVSK